MVHYFRNVLVVVSRIFALFEALKGALVQYSLLRRYHAEGATGCQSCSLFFPFWRFMLKRLKQVLFNLLHQALLDLLGFQLFGDALIVKTVAGVQLLVSCLTAIIGSGGRLYSARLVAELNLRFWYDAIIP